MAGPGRLVIRGDATTWAGAGHVMRLLALAAAWRERGGEVVLVGCVSLPFVARRLLALGVRRSDAPGAEGAVMVTDSEDATIRFRGAEAGRYQLRVLVDDEGGEIPPGYDVVWNPNPYGRPDLYTGYTGGVLTGPDVVPLSELLPRWEPGPRGETFVSVGETPPAGIREALEILAELQPEERFAIAGEWAPGGWRRVPTGELWTEASKARRLVTDAGPTVWEAAAVGIPVVLLQVAESQRLVYRWARDAGVPGLNAGLIDAEFLAHQLQALLPAARALPAIHNGARSVAECLEHLLPESAA